MTTQRTVDNCDNIFSALQQFAESSETGFLATAFGLLAHVTNKFYFCAQAMMIHC